MGEIRAVGGHFGMQHQRQQKQRLDSATISTSDLHSTIFAQKRGGTDLGGRHKLHTLDLDLGSLMVNGAIRRQEN